MVRRLHSSMLGMVLQLAVLFGVVALAVHFAATWGAAVQLAVVVAVLLATAAWAGAFVRGPPVALGSQSGVGVSSFLGVILAVLVLVIGISLAGTVLTEAGSVLSHTNIASFPLVTTIIQFLPVVYIAGLFGLAGAIAAIGVRRN